MSPGPFDLRVGKSPFDCRELGAEYSRGLESVGDVVLPEVFHGMFGRLFQLSFPETPKTV